MSCCRVSHNDDDDDDDEQEMEIVVTKLCFYKQIVQPSFNSSATQQNYAFQVQ